MRKITIPFFLILISLFFITFLYSAEKKIKTTVTKKSLSINDENVEANLKDAEELLKKGDYTSALQAFQRLNEYCNEVLKSIEIIEEKQKEALASGDLDQKSREILLWKVKRRQALKSRYREYVAKSAYYCGYIFAKRNDTMSASRYLLEALKNTDFSNKPDSIYVKSVDLLAKIHGLEGEF